MKNEQLNKGNKQRGFSAIEGLLIAVVVILLAAGAWWVWHQRRQDNKSDDTTTGEQQQEQSSDPSAEDKDASRSKQYSDALYTFTYPANWSVDPSEKESVVLKSADYEEARLIEAQHPYYVTSQGNKLTVSEIPSTAPNETLERLAAHIESEEAELGGGSHKQITVDGHQALWVNNKHEDTYLYVVVFHDGKRTQIQLNAKDDSDPNTTKLLDDILASFKLK